MAIFRINANTDSLRSKFRALLSASSARISRRFFKFLHYPHPSEAAFTDASKRGDFLKRENQYLFIPDVFSAKKSLFVEFVSFAVTALALLALVVYALAALSNTPILTVITGIVALFYFILMAFKLWIVSCSLSFDFADFTEEEIEKLTDEELPTYTVLVPLKYEAEVMGQIVEAISGIDYPEDKLEVIVCMEGYDTETIEAFYRAKPPSYMRPFIMPYVSPQTKPKTLNMALLESSGEFLVIYDAEIIPDADQLKKAYLAFRKHPDISIFQTRLDHYNADRNIITKLFNTEFSFYYDMFLPGLQKMNFPIALSGHSVHFRTETLRRAGAWDPYNVTEDCDIGMRMYRLGAKSGMINSFSKEEAASALGTWIRQRTRWMKGFIQTSVVHLRHPFRFAREIGGWKNFSVFLLTVPGTVFVNILNLATWVMFIIWIAYHPPAIKALYPQPILFVSGLSFMLGSFIFTYLNLLGAYRRGRFTIVKYALLTPLYWIALAVATTRAAFQIMRNPHSWEKTEHGTHLKDESAVKWLRDPLRA